MAISSDSSDSQYNGNGVTVAFATGFYFTQNAHIRVTVTSASGVDSLKVLGSDYTVVGARNELGGTVTMVVPPAVGEKLTLARDVPFTQEAEYPDNDPFSSQTTEDALDKLTMLCQQVWRTSDRSFRVRETDGALDEAVLILNSVFGINASGQPYFLTPNILATWLNLSQQYFDRPMKTFANDAERAIAVPEFVGQFASQRDTRVVYIANGMDAGDWDTAFILPGPGSIVASMLEDGALSADVTGRAKMADNFITLAKIGDGLFSADSSGRGKFAAGFIDSNLCASGLWRAIAPAGSIINSGQAVYTTVTGMTAVIPGDGTPPLSSEGTQILSVSITPQATSSTVRLRFSGWGALSSSGGNGAVVACFRGTTLVGVGAWIQSPANNYLINLSCEFVDSPATTSATTYTIRVGPSIASTLYINSSAGTDAFSGTASAKLVVEEIKG